MTIAPTGGARGKVESHWTDEAQELEGDFPEIVCLDVEATGLSSSIDHVIEIGAVKFRGAQVMDRYHTLVNPGVRLPSMIRRLTGIADAELARAPRLRQLLPELRRFIGDCDLLAHGAGYDIALLEQAMGEEVGGRRVFDSIDIARVVFPAAPSYSLGGLCDLVGLKHPRPHHALEDAEAAFRLFLALLRLARELPPDALRQLRELTEGSSHSLRTFFHDLVGRVDGASPPGAEPAPVVAATDAATATARPEAPELEALTPDQLAVLLGASGPLAHEPGWELREGQQELCRAVAQSFERTRNLVAEAGSGTGKSLAYLVPALAWAASRGHQVCVSTYTITLQQQLLHKDLPLAARLLGIPLRAVLLKGRAHYLSRRRWEQLLLGTSSYGDGAAAGAQGLEGMDPAELLIFKCKLTVWLNWTRTGDRDELRMFGQEERIWRAVASDWSDCRSAACLSGPSPCFYHRSRERASEADVAVVNHALLLADAFNEGASLGRFRYLVVDEAHHLEEAATRGLTDEVREEDLLRLIGIAAAASPNRNRRPNRSLTTLGDEIRALFEHLRQVGRSAHGGSELGRELRFEAGLLGSPEFAIVADAVGTVNVALQGLSDAERAVVGGLADQLLSMLRPAGDDSVTWASFGRDGRVALKRAPLEVGPILREKIFEPRDSVILTSATLAVGGSFEYFRGRVGLPASRLSELVLASPFDFLEQALLCIPDDLPEPPDTSFEAHLVGVVEAVARELEGRMLVLFTSLEQLTRASTELRRRLKPHGIEVLAQARGMGGRRALTERFASLPSAVLCGTNSFWEGLDLPARSLACVVIVRLPFAPPGDPVIRARGERLKDPFLELALPAAVIRLKQGFGRLIRRSTDHGAVVILDSRVSTRTYGRHFLEALPQCETFTGPAAELAPKIVEWIEGRHISFSDGAQKARSEAKAGSGPVRARAGGRGRQSPPAPKSG